MEIKKKEIKMLEIISSLISRSWIFNSETWCSVTSYFPLPKKSVFFLFSVWDLFNESLWSKIFFAQSSNPPSCGLLKLLPLLINSHDIYFLSNARDRILRHTRLRITERITNRKLIQNWCSVHHILQVYGRWMN